MSKFSNRLRMLALLSAFAVTATGHAVAAEKKDGKEKSRQSRQEHYAKIVPEKSTSERAGKDHSERDKDHSERDDDGPKTLKTSVVTVTNRGGGPLTITAAPTITRLSGNGSFAIVQPETGTACAASLVVAPRGGKCTIGVQYTASGKGVSTARLSLSDTGAETTTQEAIIKSD